MITLMRQKRKRHLAVQRPLRLLNYRSVAYCSNGPRPIVPKAHDARFQRWYGLTGRVGGVMKNNPPASHAPLMLHTPKLPQHANPFPPRAPSCGPFARWHIGMPPHLFPPDSENDFWKIAPARIHP